jgi:hypothetical protein
VTLTVKLLPIREVCTILLSSMDLTHPQQVSSSPRSLAAVVIALKEGIVECPLNIQAGTQLNLLMIQGIFQSLNNLEESCFCRHTCPIGKLFLMKWSRSQNTIPDVYQVISQEF